MNVLFIIPSFPKEEKGSNIYTDLAEEISKKHNIKVIVTEEKRNISQTQMQKERNMDVLRVKTGNLYGVSFVEKGITFITMQIQMKKAIKKYFRNEKFDLILYMAPPVTLGSVVKYAMKKFNAKSYLMQKDIFPQNSLDLKIMSKKNPMYYYFKYKERQTYKVASKIGCMSKENIKYLLKNNTFLEEEKLEIFPNTIKLKSPEKPEISIREKYKISSKKVLAMYGGNFGKPQGIDFIIRVLEEYKDNDKVVFFFSGKGTEKDRLFKYIKENNFTNIITQDYIPRKEYLQILQETDIGLVFLDYRFSIPNIPSRTLSYFENSIPIMAATDKNTDYKEILVDDAKAGLWCESNNIDEFKKQFDYFIEHPEERKEMGRNGRKFLEENWTVDMSVKIIENTYKHLKESV